MLEDTKAEIRSRKSKKDKQHTGKKEKEKQWVTFCCSGRVSSSCSTFDTRRVTVKRHERHLIWKSSWTPEYVIIYTMYK